MNGQTQSKAYIPLPGGAQVKYIGATISTYRLLDWLGSPRDGSNPNRTYSWGVAYAPFGERYASSGSPMFSFTGANGDTKSDLYDFQFRELHSSQGRWISPDPAGVSAVQLQNPQSWNRYAYVGNMPLQSVDSLGLLSDDAIACTVSCGGGGVFAAPTGQLPGDAPGNGSGCTVSIGGGISIDFSACPVGGRSGREERDRPGSDPNKAANNGNCQAPFLCKPTTTPVVQKPPTSPDTHTYKYSDYVECAFGTEINDMFGDKGKAATTVLINIAPLAPTNLLKAPPWFYLGVAATWDIGHALKARSECTASVYGR